MTGEERVKTKKLFFSPERHERMSENLQILKFNAQISLQILRLPPPIKRRAGVAEVRRARRIHADTNRLIVHAPKEARQLAQLLPAVHLVIVVDPERVAEALHLDAQIVAGAVVRR